MGIDDRSMEQTLPSIEQLKERMNVQSEQLRKQEYLIPNKINTSLSSLNNTWSFTQGFIIGQISVIALLIVFIKFFVFADGNDLGSSSARDISGVIVRREGALSGNNKVKKNSSHDNETETSNGNNTKIQTILEKTYYDVCKHAPESLDWFNVLVAQTISQVRAEALLSENIYHSLNDFLSELDLPEYLDKINLTEIDIGDDFPIFSNCRITHSKDNSGRLEAKIDVDLSDTLTIGIDTKLLLNYPKPATAVLPVQLSVSIVRFSGCLTVSLANTHDLELMDFDAFDKENLTSSPNKNDDRRGASIFKNTDKEQDTKAKLKRDVQENTQIALLFSFSPDYRLEFMVKSLIGSRAKLQDVPKISALVESKLRSWFTERCVEPRFQVIKLPSMWPRRKNTREPFPNGPNGVVNNTDSSF